MTMKRDIHSCHFCSTRQCQVCSHRGSAKLVRFDQLCVCVGCNAAFTDRRRHGIPIYRSDVVAS